MNIITKIQEKYTQLTPSQKRVVDVILEKKKELKNINIKKLAELSDVSIGTITKVAYILGFENFVELKLSLAQLEEKKISYNPLFEKTYNYYKQSVDQSNSLISEAMIKKLVQEINHAKGIYLYGLGSSGLTAKEFEHRLQRMGYRVRAFVEFHDMIINSTLLEAKDLILAFSVSGQTKEIISSIKIAKENRTRAYGITSFFGTPLQDICDETLIVSNNRMIDDSQFINTQFGALYFIDLICTLILEDPEKSKKMQRTIGSIIKERR